MAKDAALSVVLNFEPFLSPDSGFTNPLSLTTNPYIYLLIFNS